jgi:hypothetical protein
MYYRSIAVSHSLATVYFCLFAVLYRLGLEKLFPGVQGTVLRLLSSFRRRVPGLCLGKGKLEAWMFFSALRVAQSEFLTKLPYSLGTCYFICSRPYTAWIRI